MNKSRLFGKWMLVGVMVAAVGCQSPSSSSEGSGGKAPAVTETANDGPAFEMSKMERMTYNQANLDARNAEESQGKLPHYRSALAMLIGQGDYTGGAKCLKAVDGDPGHIQICFDFLLHDNVKYIPQRRRSNIIYVAMQVFAMTDLDSVEISCAPMGTKDGQTGAGVMGEYLETVTVSRKKADKVMQKYLKTADYDVLMERQGGYWTTTEAFDKLMVKEDSLVYLDLVD